MRTWFVTEADRTPEGKIRTLADLLPPQPEKEEHTAPERPRWKVGKLEAAGLVSGLVLAAALIAGLNTFWPTRTPRLTGPTAMPAPTFTIVSTPTATRTPTPTATPEPPTATPEPPTPEVVYIEVPPACDPQVNPRYSVHIDLSPLGSVTGVSCSSLEEAQQNADRMAAEMRAAAGKP